MESKNVILVAIDKSEQSEDAFKCEYVSWGVRGGGGVAKGVHRGVQGGGVDKSEQSEDAFKCEYMYVCS